MSSHHFVKEGQEPAVFFLDAISSEAVMSLLEWAPQVLVHERCLEGALSWGIKIDVVVSIEPIMASVQQMLAQQQPYQVLTTGSQSPIESVMEWLNQTSGSLLTVVADAPQEIVQALIPEKRVPGLTVVSKSWRWSVVQGAIEKWMPAGLPVSLYGTSDAVKTDGLRQEGSEFIVARDGIVRIEDRKPFWMGVKNLENGN